MNEDTNAECARLARTHPIVEYRDLRFLGMTRWEATISVVWAALFSRSDKMFDKWVRPAVKSKLGQP